MGPRDRSGIMISFPYKFGSLLKSHLEHFSGASWPVPSPVSAPGATLSTSLCWGESILSGLYPLSRDTSAAQRAQCVCGGGGGVSQLTELWLCDFNRFTAEDWFPVVMRNAQAKQQPHFNHLSGWKWHCGCCEAQSWLFAALSLHLLLFSLIIASQMEILGIQSAAEFLFNVNYMYLSTKFLK